jgi:hypothetical protein
LWTPAQINREKKSIVKMIKKNLVPVKFHSRDDRTTRKIKFTVERLPPEAAEELLLSPQRSWTSSTVIANLGANDSARALSLTDGELTGTVCSKARKCWGRDVNAWRMGKAALQVQAVSLSYNIKSQQLSGTLECINEDRLLPPPETVWERNQKKTPRTSGVALLAGLHAVGLPAPHVGFLFVQVLYSSRFQP